MTLHHEARLRWGNHCPCCNARFTTKRPRPFVQAAPNLKTEGHDVAIARGGDPDVWLYMCRRCNGEKGGLSFEVWQRKLALAGDPRGARVAVVAAFIRQTAFRASTVPPRPAGEATGGDAR